MINLFNRFARTALAGLMTAGLVLGGVTTAVAQTAGTPDVSFSGDGQVTTLWGDNFSLPIIRDVVRQSDGKLVFCASPVISGLNQFGLIRYNQDGTVDNTFGTSGKVQTFFAAGKSGVAKLVLLAGDKILAGGTHFSGSQEYHAFARYNADGTLDNTFGTSGKYLNGDQRSASDFLVQPSGKIIIAGYTDLGIQITRLTANGAIDPTFATNGEYFLDSQTFDYSFISDVEAQSDGKLLFVAHSQVNPNGLTVFRLTADGVLDQTFGTNGFAYQDFTGTSPFFAGAYPNGTIRVLPNDSYILTSELLEVPFAGQANFDVYYRPQVSKYSATGDLDVTFGTAGFYLSPFLSLKNVNNNQTLYANIQIESTGKIVFAQAILENPPLSADPPKGIRVARLNANGSLDNTYGTGGYFVYTDPTFAQPSLLKYQADGKLYVATDAPGGISIFRLNGVPNTSSFAFSSASRSEPEGNTGFIDYTYNVTLADATVFPATVQVLVSSPTGEAYYSTSTANRDWTLLPGSPSNRTRTLSFTTNGTQAVTIRIYGDTRTEANEVLNLTLQNAVNGSIEVVNGSRTHTIVNDESTQIGGGGITPDVNFTGPASVTVNEGSFVNVPLLTSNVVGTLTFEVSYSFNNQTTNWGTASNSPVAGGGSPADWRPYPINNFVTQFTLGNNQTRNVQIVAFADAITESNETIILTLPGTGGQKQVTVTIQDLAGRAITDEEFVAGDLKVYPNPSTGRFFVETVATGLIEITDLTGRLVVSQNAIAGTNELNIDTAPAGVYTVRVTDASGNVVANSRLLKN